MNARRARERHQAERDRLRQHLTDSYAATPRYLETLSNGCEAWMRGRVMFILPPLVEDYPVDIKAAIDRRRRASLSGECDCGAMWNVTRRGLLDMEHEPGCDATDGALDALAAEHGLVFPRWVS